MRTGLIAFGLLVSTGTAFGQCLENNPLTVVSSTDDGLYEETHGPENAIDGDLDPDSRWSNLGQGEPKHLLLNLGAIQTVKGIGLAWYKGDERKATFAVDASMDAQTWQVLAPVGLSSGQTLDFESLEFEPTQAQYLRIAAEGNESNEWNSIVEVQVTGCGVYVEPPSQPVLTARQNTGLFGLDPNVSPGENFDLLGWYITTPADDDGNGRSDNTFENDLASGWTDERFFYTDPITGGMVFRVTPAGARTSQNTNYTRTELRGMLRRGDDSIATRGVNDFPNGNNWVFSSAPLEAKFNSGGVDGVMRATLAVNQVTRMGNLNQIGRVIIGQIHARDDEPIRLYYRKLPGNQNGSIYFVHAPAIGKERWVTLIGNRSDRALDPQDGIALDEVFSYEIEVDGVIEGEEIIPYLYVKIIREDGTEVVAEPLDMRESGFSVENEFMFFKAGAYTGNNTSPYPERDFDLVTFYELETSHNAPPRGAWIQRIIDEERERLEALAAEGTPPHPATPGIILDDQFADGDRMGGSDPNGGVWYTTSASSAIEIEPGGLGLVSGSSGRGIRTVFEPQTLSVGQSIQARFTFETPQTVGFDRQDAFRVGFHDRLERAELEQDLSASSGGPNPLYNGLPGYMITFDVNREDPALNNVDIRKHRVTRQVGRLMGTYQGYDLLAEGGDSFVFEPNQTYSGVATLSKTVEGLEISGELSNEQGVMTQFAYVDQESLVNNIGMLSFHVNSRTFGASAMPERPDNGVTFKQVTIEILEAL